jgi:uncharacterized protein (TIGR00730 family)
MNRSSGEIPEGLFAQLEQALGLELVGASQRELLISMVRTVTTLADPKSDLLDLKIADAALKEMANAFEIFRPYRHIPKLTMFGSARTQPHDPIYSLAVDLAALVAQDGWMVITGAGPGIMQAGIEGAGSERSFGVNILLPFEQGANPLIALDPKLMEMRYFFTRKLMMVKESDAYAILPGGYGTLDEAFELLTLLQTGKAQPAPLIFLETEAGSYWEGWRRFVDEQALARSYVSPEDDCLYKIVNSADEAVAEIHAFYRNYHSIRMVGRTMVIRMEVLPSPSEIAALNQEFADIVVEGAIEATEPLGPERSSEDHLELARLKLRFNRMHFGRLRQLIDRINECGGH